MSNSAENGSSKTPLKKTPESERPQDVTSHEETPPQSLNKTSKLPQALNEDQPHENVNKDTKTFGSKIKKFFRKNTKPKRKRSITDSSKLVLLKALSPFSLSDSEFLSQNGLTDKKSDFEFGGRKETITLYEEFRLVERPEKEINAAWKGAHLILFFLTFVFGSFCTFCFNILIYMFDEKCILSPKIVAVKDVKRSNPTGIIIDYIGAKDDESMPVEFVTTIWVEKSHCYLPTYVPLLSGICGLIWTTMFLMSSSGTQTLSGLQRPWRIVPAVFIFSTIMSILCIYTSVTTHKGLLELCYRLAEVFGSDTCSYTINVATLTYERRIRGVYQATRLTIAAAWLHTLCWVSAALLALARVLLVVDFRLVRVRADLIGNIELMLERHEKLIRTNEYWNDTDAAVTKQKSPESIKVHFLNKGFGTESETKSLGDKNIGNASKEEDKIIATLARDIVDQMHRDRPSMSPHSSLKKSGNRLFKSSSEHTLMPSTENQQQVKIKRTESEKTLTFKLNSDDEEDRSYQDKKKKTKDTAILRVPLKVKPQKPTTPWDIAFWFPDAIKKEENKTESSETVKDTQGRGNDDDVTPVPSQLDDVPKPGPSHTKDEPSQDEEKGNKLSSPKKEKEKQD